MEIWRNITGFEGDYQVSNMGRLKSIKFRKEVILKPRDRKGYDSYILYGHEIPKTVNGHVIVANEFLDRPKGKFIVVDHINNNKKDNRLINLRYVTAIENVARYYRKKKGSVGGQKHSSGKYQSTISFNGKDFYLGIFKTKAEAVAIYQKNLERVKKGIAPLQT
ncbi:NUMOD4 motif-containing HNH endonuclease [Muricauda sp. CAU 1633]|uniref:NUMOD4 domain-containing protein n=1 Tax=Allomuricauda sp. CAU 1633 TaxID=2816036 RepID=UPI001A8FB8AB|nr:NUMOD4 domain-containing protein [Muricauda sp. CAU 1633]MBO0323455.1 NUMOD4 motif-containing HNH endonuclease [Muricauda sp. CAU 1633]